MMDVYDFIIQTGAYVDDIESLKYVCNYVEKKEQKYILELTDAKEYKIIAKDFVIYYPFLVLFTISSTIELFKLDISNKYIF